ncbi:MAG: hypothetical protein HY904_18710 [Deltaproteobacteria bacterium]|nr:hypothetical protein [Deltaproteobacteria bacterium]
MTTRASVTACSELRRAYGPGYRLYFTMRKRVVVVLLAGGDKQPQARDILRAKTLAKNLNEEDQP